MRRLFALLTALAVLTPVWADPPDVDFRERLGKAATDQFKWFSSGAIKGSAGIQTDTLIAGTLSDTSYAIDIAGAQAISVTIIAREGTYTGGDNVKLTVYFQVADSNATAAAWHTMPTTTYSASVSAADTTFVMALNPAFPDTVFAAQTGMTSFTHGEQAMVRTSRYLRLILDPTAYTGDTFEVRAALTRIYPR